MSKTIPVRCDVKLLIPYADIVPVQGDLKEFIDQASFNRLLNSITKNGLDFATHVWRQSPDQPWHMIDGHGRQKVVKHLVENEGYEPPLFPCVETYADTFDQAKEKIFRSSSTYHHLTVEGLHGFIEDFDSFDAGRLKEYDLPEIDIAEFHNAYYPEVTDVSFQAKTDTSEAEESVPETPKEPTTKPGDIYILGDHVLLCGDSTLRSDVERLGLKNETFCFTSPPYSDLRDYGGCDISPEYLAKFIEASPCFLFAVNLGLIKRDHAVVKYWEPYIAAAEANGLKLLSWNVWDKQQCGSIGHQIAMFPLEHEWIFIFGKAPIQLNKTELNKHAGKPTTSAQREKDGSIKHGATKPINEKRSLGSVLRHYPEKARNHGCDHPAMFPVGMPEKYILAVTQPNASVYDPFLGSGTTLIACEKTGRRCFGMEIYPAYCDVIVKRWSDFTGKTAVRA